MANCQASPQGLLVLGGAHGGWQRQEQIQGGLPKQVRFLARRRVQDDKLLAQVLLETTHESTQLPVSTYTQCPARHTRAMPADQIEHFPTHTMGCVDVTWQVQRGVAHAGAQGLLFRQQRALRSEVRGVPVSGDDLFLCFQCVS